MVFTASTAGGLPPRYRIDTERLRRSRVALLLVALLAVGALHAPPSAQAQERPIISPRTSEATVRIQRGRDIVQAPSLWYQEGDAPPDSIGLLRVPCCTGDPDAITYRDANLRFPVHLQFATFIRDGQIAELPISEDVLRGTKEGRLYIRPPAEDFYDIAEPYGVEPLWQLPGEETVIDVSEWYEASLRNPDTGQAAPSNRFHTIRELRGRLRSTAPGGESIEFMIVANRVRPPVVTLTPIPQEPIVVPEPRLTIALRTEPTRRSQFDWITTTALLVGPHRASIPSNNRESYAANRIKGDATSTLRWHASPSESYALTVFGSSQPTFGDGYGSHHDVPYGLALAARFGAEHAVELRAEAQYEDDPFQRQSFRLGDQRLRLMAGYARRTADRSWRLSVGPTYYRDQPSSWEGDRADARELGYTLDGRLDQTFRLGDLATTLSVTALLNQSWGYIDDAGNHNTTAAGRLALKPNAQFGNVQVRFGPVAYLSRVHNEYAEIDGFSEFNAQFGAELTTHVRF